MKHLEKVAKGEESSGWPKELSTSDFIEYAEAGYEDIEAGLKRGDIGARILRDGFESSTGISWE